MRSLLLLFLIKINQTESAEQGLLSYVVYFVILIMWKDFYCLFQNANSLK